MMDFRPRRRRRSRLTPKLRLPSIFTVSKLTRYAFFAVIAGVLAVPLLFLWYSRDLPTPGKLVSANVDESTGIYDRNGKLLYSIYQDQNRTYVDLSEIPKSLKEATIAIEDQDFYKNKGFSLVAYVRVLWNFIRGKGLAGGSTISQQLVKNVLLTNERSLERKAKELALSIQVNQRFSKDQILEMYLNNIPYGGTAYGVEAAAQTYFGKKAKDLTLAESVLLAGLPQSPSVYSPYSGNKYYIGRSEAVLRQMVDNRYITKEQADKALEEIKNFKFSQRDTTLKAAHFVMYVKNILAKQFGEEYVATAGLRVITTLDYELQKEAEKIVKEEIDSLKQYKVSNGASMITDPRSGEILAMVGSKDYFDTDNDGNFNVALDGQRQPGSALKPLVYARAFEKGFTPAYVLMDVKTEFPTQEPANPTYTPVNYDGKFRGPVQVRFALGNSLNIPAVKMLARTGISDVMQKAYDMGVRNWEPTSENVQNVGLSLVLGGRETTLFDMVTAYGVLANKGIRQDLVSILKVTDKSGKVIYEFEEREGEKVLSPDVAFLISHILLDNNARSDAFGQNSYLRIPSKTVAVKTGTTDEKRDNWTFGYTPSRVVGVWVGNNDRSPMNQAIASGVTGASPIWNKLMQVALKDRGDEQFEKPENVEAVQIDAQFGGLPIDGQPTRVEFFIKGTQPTSRSPIYQKEFYVFREEDPVSTDGKNRWQEGIDAWIEAIHKDDPKYHPPGDILDKKPDNTPTPTPEEGSEPTPTPTPTPTP